LHAEGKKISKYCAGPFRITVTDNVGLWIIWSKDDVTTMPEDSPVMKRRSIYMEIKMSFKEPGE